MSAPLTFGKPRLDLSVWGILLLMVYGRFKRVVDPPTYDGPALEMSRAGALAVIMYGNYVYQKLRVDEVEVLGDAGDWYTVSGRFDVLVTPGADYCDIVRPMTGARDDGHIDPYWPVLLIGEYPEIPRGSIVEVLGPSIPFCTA